MLLKVGCFLFIYFCVLRVFVSLLVSCNSLPRSFLEYLGFVGTYLLSPFCGIQNPFLAPVLGSPGKNKRYKNDLGRLLQTPFCRPHGPIQNITLSLYKSAPNCLRCPAPRANKNGQIIRGKRYTQNGKTVFLQLRSIFALIVL